jgi:hypothetical protein
LHPSLHILSNHEQQTSGAPGPDDPLITYGLPKEVHLLVYDILGVSDLDAVAGLSRFHRHLCLKILKRRLSKVLWPLVNRIEGPTATEESTYIHGVGQGLLKRCLHEKDYSAVRRGIGEWAFMYLMPQDAGWNTRLRAQDPRPRYRNREEETFQAFDPYVLPPPTVCWNFRHLSFGRIEQFVNRMSLRAALTECEGGFKGAFGYLLFRASLTFEGPRALSVVKKLVGFGVYKAPLDPLPCISDAGIASYLISLPFPVPFSNSLLNTNYRDSEPDAVLEVYASHLEDLSLMGEDGNTLLHIATRKRCVRLVKHLLSRGLDKEKRNDEGKTPYDLASNKALRGLLE